MDETPSTVAGKGKYRYRSPVQINPATKPNKALKGILLNGLSTNPNPVTTSKIQTSTLQAPSSKTTNPLANNKIPRKNPKYPNPFRTFPAEPLTKKLNNREAATTPPKTKMNGAKPISTEKLTPIKADRSKQITTRINRSTSHKDISKKSERHQIDHIKNYHTFKDELREIGSKTERLNHNFSKEAPNHTQYLETREESCKLLFTATAC
jgi:hypothetical protein